MREFNQYKPKIGEDVFIASTAVVEREVELKAKSSIWFNAVLRGDVNSISIGEGSNVQDGTVVHVADDHPAIVKDYVTIGHGAIIHGCTIEDCCLIGMGAIILNGAHIGKGSIVAAGALVPEGAEIPPNSLVMGIPGKVVRTIDKVEENKAHALKYIQVAKNYK